MSAPRTFDPFDDGWPQDLSTKHRKYLGDRGVSPEVAAKRGYLTATRKTGNLSLANFGFGKAAAVTQNVSESAGNTAMVLPMYHHDSSTPSVYQARLDKARNHMGKSLKFEMPHGVKRGTEPGNMPADVHPMCHSAIDDFDIPLIITEGIPKGDALLTAALAEGIEIVPISLTGVTLGYEATASQGDMDTVDREVSANLRVLCEGRSKVYLCWDSDWDSKPMVRKSLVRTGMLLENIGVEEIIYLSIPNDGIFTEADLDAKIAAEAADKKAGNPAKQAADKKDSKSGPKIGQVAATTDKTGVDDWLAAGGSLEFLLEHCQMEQPKVAGVNDDASALDVLGNDPSDPYTKPIFEYDEENKVIWGWDMMRHGSEPKPEPTKVVKLGALVRIIQVMSARKIVDHILIVDEDSYKLRVDWLDPSSRAPRSAVLDIAAVDLPEIDKWLNTIGALGTVMKPVSRNDGKLVANTISVLSSGTEVEQIITTQTTGWYWHREDDLGDGEPCGWRYIHAGGWVGSELSGKDRYPHASDSVMVRTESNAQLVNLAIQADTLPEPESYLEWLSGWLFGETVDKTAAADGNQLTTEDNAGLDILKSRLAFGAMVNARSILPGSPAKGTPMLEGPPGSGKLLTLDTPIPTPDGWKKMGEIAVGDQVIGNDGLPCNVTFLSDINPTPDLYAITLDDGQVIHADADHQWSVIDRDARTRASEDQRSNRRKQRWIDFAETLESFASTFGPDDASTTGELLTILSGIEGNRWTSQPGLHRALARAGVPYENVESSVDFTRGGRDESSKKWMSSYPTAVAIKGLASVCRIKAGEMIDVTPVRRVVNTATMLTEGVTDTTKGANGYRFTIPIAGAVQLPEADLPLDPYILGAWLGDGTACSGQFTAGSSDACTSDDGTLDRDRLVAKIIDGGFPAHVLKNGSTIGTTGLQVRLREIGVLNNKHIPNAYLRSSIEQRLALVQGLMDTDGSVDEGGSCELCLCDPKLAATAAELLRSLGIKVSVTSGPATITEDDPDNPGLKRRRVTSTRYRMHFKTDLEVFTLPRKVARLNGPSRTPNHVVVSIEPIATRPGRCIQVDSHDSTYLCAGFVTTHNTLLARVWTSAFGAAFGDKVYTSLSSTAAGVEVQLADARNLAVVVDDFHPGSQKDMETMNKIVDTIARGAYDGAVKSRSTRDLKSMTAPQIAGTVILTGEELPNQSAASNSTVQRLLVLQVKKATTPIYATMRNLCDNSELQRNGITYMIGQLAVMLDRIAQDQIDKATKDGMTGLALVRAVNANTVIDALLKEIEPLVDELETDMMSTAQTLALETPSDRSKLAIRDMLVGGALLIRMAQDLDYGLRTRKEQMAQFKKLKAVLADSAAAVLVDTARIVSETSPERRVVELIKSVLGSDGHLMTTTGGGPGGLASSSWGWKHDEQHGWQPQGNPIGYVLWHRGQPVVALDRALTARALARLGGKDYTDSRLPRMLAASIDEDGKKLLAFGTPERTMVPVEIGDGNKRMMILLRPEVLGVNVSDLVADKSSRKAKVTKARPAGSSTDANGNITDFVESGDASSDDDSSSKDEGTDA